jgi:hypothetical protein
MLHTHVSFIYHRGYIILATDNAIKQHSSEFLSQSIVRGSPGLQTAEQGSRYSMVCHSDFGAKLKKGTFEMHTYR